jgi:hypothetical protein
MVLQKEATEDDEGWKMLSLIDAADSKSALWKIDETRREDSGTYRVIAFGETFENPIIQTCSVTVKGTSEQNALFADARHHDLNVCIDAMNADGAFFLDLDDLRLPLPACKVAFEFCQGVQGQFCEPETACELEVKCRHLIRDCYIQHYDSRQLFSECFYSATSHPHSVSLSKDATFRMIETDLVRLHSQEFSMHFSSTTKNKT